VFFRIRPSFHAHLPPFHFSNSDSDGGAAPAHLLLDRRFMHVWIAVAGLVLFVAAPAHAQYRAVTFAAGFTGPIAFVQDPSNPSIQYVAEQRGIIRVIRNGVVEGTPFLDLSAAIGSTAGGESGLLGLAFAPDYGSSGRFYVNFTRPLTTDEAAASLGEIDRAPVFGTVVARFTRSAGNPIVANAASRKDLVWSTGKAFIPQPYANHNAGCLAFGPDGYLYVALGDGGSGNDPQNYAQNTSSLLGKILRLDVAVSTSHPAGFVVPPGNAGLARPEIWSLGLRNPWKFSFDDPDRGGTGAMLIADVGQGALEEVNYEPAATPGRNYGWRNFEGTRSNIASPPPVSTPVPPIYEYGRTAGRSITGGHVYRGSAEFVRGRYFFADYASQRVWSFAIDATGGAVRAVDAIDHTNDLVQSAIGNVSAFGVDASGELYIVNHTGGRILRVIMPVPPTPPTNVRIVR
jgi:glucose/arabinose dehydrogenase